VSNASDDDLTIGPASTATSTPSGSQRFIPGVVVAGRYRFVALAGRGGMGEVYRAEDLTLEQPVALKFLPADVAADPSRLAQFHNELRIARQVSHKNVCRLYDLGEIVFALAMISACTVVLFRYGLLPLAIALFVDDVVTAVPMTPHLSAWWSGASTLTIVAFATLAAFAFYASRAGQPLLGGILTSD
jgi:hypothetical protein